VVTEPSGRRLMLLDSDTVFTGRVIDRLQQFGEELVVDKEDFSPAAIGVQFFPVDKLL
jgi:choline kinase